MPSSRTGLIVLNLVVLLLPAAQADHGLSEPTWTTDQVRRALGATETRESLRPLLDLARSGEHSLLLDELRSLAADETHALPVRERLLFEFAVSLSDLDSRAASPGVLAFLLAYEPRVLVPHEDAPKLGSPLYNIRGAAAGAVHDWERQEVVTTAMEAAVAEPGSWLAAWLASDPAQGQGYLDSLAFLPQPTLRKLAERAAAGLSGEPALTPVVSRSAVLLADSALLQSLVANGRGPDIAPALKSANMLLDESERLGLLNDALLNAPAANAALVVAEFAPGLLHQPEAAALLFGLLGHPDLGASAALALSRSPDVGIHERLAELAAEGKGLESRRAALAESLASDAARRGEPR
jgi:hypothetical protein